MTIASTSDATARFNLLNKAPGDYDVEVTTDFGTDKLDDYFAVYCAEPVADFTADPVTGDAPLTVQFTDTSTDYNGCRVQLWSWNFGDAGTSHDPSPTHVYTHSGTYDVTLTVQSLGGQVMKRKRNFINVTGAPDDDDADDDADDDVDDDADDDVDDDASDDDDFNPPGSHDDDADDDDEDIITPDDDEPAGRGGDDDDDSGTCGK
ncbi:MAG: PKD domain-containing protein [Deltaproteobacteria bacterium]|nr:PKD domain-containing protein [Deltaproteobacteria bacterium]